MENAKGILARDNSLIGDMLGTAADQHNKLAMGVEEEKRREAMGTLASKEERDKMMRSLNELLDDAGTLSTSAFEKRMSQIEAMEKHMEASFDELVSSGNSELADMMKNSLTFAKKIMGAMVDMKMKMYNDMKLQGAAGESAKDTEFRYAALREAMLKNDEMTKGKTAALEAALSKKLAALGIQGKMASQHLAMFLNQLTFQLASGEQNGFEKLLGELSSQFGLALKQGDDVHNVLGGTMDALHMKQSAMRDLMSAMHVDLLDLNKNFDASRDRIWGSLGKEQQLATMTDAELKEKVVELKEIITNLVVRERLDPSQTSLIEHDKEESLDARLSLLEEQAKREAGHHNRAKDEQEALDKKLQSTFKAMKALAVAHKQFA